MRRLGKALEVINRKKSYVNFPYLTKVEPPKNRAAINAFLVELPVPSRKRLSNKTPQLLLPEEYTRGIPPLFLGVGFLGHC